MKNIKNTIAIMAFALLFLGVPTIASAQWGGYGNGGYGNQGYYGDIRGTVNDLKSRAKNFERMTDRNNGGRYGGYINNNIEDLADRFSKAANRLDDKYGRGRNLNNSVNEARNVLNIGRQIESMMYSSRGGGYLQNEWYAISNDLNIIAQAYNMPYNGSNNRRGNRYPNGNYPNGNYPNGNYPNNRGARRPSWWPF